MYQVHHKPNSPPEPRGELASRILAMPSHTNPMGNIFGGWIMSVMDAAALMTATKIANGTVVTVFVSNMAFLEPVRVGDAICCYTDTIAIGETSITLAVEVWVLRQGQGEVPALAWRVDRKGGQDRLVLRAVGDSAIRAPGLRLLVDGKPVRADIAGPETTVKLTGVRRPPTRVEVDPAGTWLVRLQRED